MLFSAIALMAILVVLEGMVKGQKLRHPDSLQQSQHSSKTYQVKIYW
jgi:hypothetical protein